MSTRTGTTGIAPFVIQDDAIPQPAAFADQLNKGWHTRNTLAERNAMPLHYRGWGMVCVVTNDDANNGVYQLMRPSPSIADDDEEALMDNSNWAVFAGGNSSIKTFNVVNYVYTADQYAQMQPGDWIFNVDGNTGYARGIDKVSAKGWQPLLGNDYHAPQLVNSAPADDTGNDYDVAVIVYNNVNHDNHWADYYVKNNGSWQLYSEIRSDVSPFITGDPAASTNPLAGQPGGYYIAINDVTYVPYVFYLSTEWLTSLSIAPNTDATPTENSANTITSGGVKQYVDNAATALTGRVFYSEPPAGWKTGDIWLHNDAAGSLQEVRKITSNAYGWGSYQPYSPLVGYVVFSPTYNVLAPLDVNGTNGDYTWCAAIPVGPPYGPKNGNIWIEYFKKINGHWVSQLQIISSVSPYSNGHASSTDGVIVNTGDRIAMDNYDGYVHVYKYTPVPYIVLAKVNTLTTLSTNPTANDIANGTYTAIKNASTGSINLWANDNGILKSVAFT